MPDLSVILPFMAAGALLLVVPGPVVCYLVARSISQGRVAGWISILGVSVGSICHILAAALGVAQLVENSPTSFLVLKYLGAGYLVYLGIRAMRRKQAAIALDAPEAKHLGGLFVEGFWVNLLNPKGLIFFFAFLPQFVIPGGSSTMSQILFLGLIFVIMSIITDGLWVLLSDLAARRLSGLRAFPPATRYVEGGVLTTLGIAAALFG